MYTILRLLSYIGIVLISAKMLYDYRLVFKLEQSRVLRPLWWLFLACCLYGFSGIISVLSLYLGVSVEAVRLLLTPFALYMLFAVYLVMRTFVSLSTSEVADSFREYNEHPPV